MPYLTIAMRCLLGAVFLTSFVGKVSGRTAFGFFVASLEDMRVLPARVTRSAAALVVAAEGVVCVLLTVPLPAAALAGFAMSAALLLSFTVGIVLSVRRGVRAPCRCFGTSSTTPLGHRQVVRNLLLTAGATAGTAAAVPAGEQAHLGGLVVAGLGGLLLGMLVTVSDDLLGLFETTGSSGSRP